MGVFLNLPSLSMRSTAGITLSEAFGKTTTLRGPDRKNTRDTRTGITAPGRRAAGRGDYIGGTGAGNAAGIIGQSSRMPREATVP